MMKVIGKKVRDGKAQHLRVGKEYEVTDEQGKAMIANGQAELPKKSRKKK